MSKFLKGLMRDDLKTKFEGADGGLLVDASGLNSEQTYNFRAMLHQRNLKYTVVRNALARLTFQEYGYTQEDLEKVFQGPVGVVYSTEEGSALSGAKAVAAWKKETKDKIVKWKGAFMEGSVMGPKDAEALKDAPGRSEAYAMLAGVLQAPVVQLLGTVREPHMRFLYVLNNYGDKRKESEG